MNLLMKLIISGACVIIVVLTYFVIYRGGTGSSDIDTHEIVVGQSPGQILKNQSQTQLQLESVGAGATGEGTMFRAVFVTCPSIEVAKKISHGLIAKKLAACVNIIPGVTSVYEWEGKVNEDNELILMIKTQSHLFDELSAFVKENHPYSVPEVIGVPIEQGSKDYLNWLKEITDQHKKSE